MTLQGNMDPAALYASHVSLPTDLYISYTAISKIVGEGFNLLHVVYQALNALQAV